MYDLSKAVMYSMYHVLDCAQCCDFAFDVFMHDIGSVVSIVIVTSPVPINPSTELIDRVLSSLRLLGGLQAANTQVHVQIVCDGILLGSKKTKRNAEMTEARIAAYEQYKRHLIARFGRTCDTCGCGCECGNRGSSSSRSGGKNGPRPLLHPFDISVTELEGWHGFGWGLRHALTLIHTPQVLVLPHDMEFEARVDLRELCAILTDDSNRVEYIGFANRNLLNYAERVKAKSGIDLVPLQIPSSAASSTCVTTLLPLFRWKENPHLANCSKYASVVFGPEAWPKVKRGQFIEETIGQRQNDLILSGGTGGWQEEHAQWGTYLYWPPQVAADDAGETERRPAPAQNGSAVPPTTAITYHLDGHTYRTIHERLALGHTPHPFEFERSEAAASLFADGDALAPPGERGPVCHTGCSQESLNTWS